MTNDNHKSGKYLIVADNSEEFPLAAEYAAHLAKNNDVDIAMLRVIEAQDFTHWGDIQERLTQELRQAAEELVSFAAGQIYAVTGRCPSIYIEEGERREILLNIINHDDTIKMLILAGDTGSSGPGPLAHYLVSKGLSQLRIPVLIIPDHIDPNNVEELI